MSIYADEGTAAHWALEQCLISLYTFGIPAKGTDYTGARVFLEAETEEKKQHSQLSPSSADRWMQCPGSVQMSRAFQDEAGEGPRHITIAEDYAIAVQEILDYIAARISELTEKTGSPPIIYTERRVSPHEYLDTHDCDGRVDITLMSDTEVEIIDAKFGAGTPVMPNSRQLQLYLLGVVSEHPEVLSKNARVTIAQPRCTKVLPTIRSEDIRISRWKDGFIAECLAAIKATKQEPPILKPSESACRFCPARGQCSVATRHALTQATVLEGHIPVTAEDLYDTLEQFANLDPFQLTAGQMRAIIDGSDFLVATIAAVKKLALHMIEKGEATQELTDAYKLVRADTHRRWIHDAKETEKRLKKIKILDPETQKTRALGRKDITETALKSVPRMEKMLIHHFGVPRKDARFDAFQTLINKPEGALILAPISDPRPEIRSDQDPQHALGTGPDIPLTP